MHKFFLTVLFLCIGAVNAQEFNATVAVNAEQTGNPNLQVYKTLERSVTEFINNTKWTESQYRTEERIDCSFFLTILGNVNDSFTATLQVQASRPVYGSNYDTTILNINDKQFSFKYLEFQPLNYNPSNFESNLISVVAFYLYTILGVDSDTFEKNSGTSYHQEAKAVVNNAQGSNSLGWNAQDGQQTRFRLNDDILSGTFDGYRAALYSYHREGLDLMNNDLKKGKEAILESVKTLEGLHRTRPNSYIMRVFFDVFLEALPLILPKLWLY